MAGQRFGLIRFGSRTDLYLPLGWACLVIPGQRVNGGETVVAVDDGDDDRGTRRELVTEACLDAALQLVPGEPADQAPGGGAHHDGGEHRRGEEAHDQADTTAPAQALAAQVVAGLGHLYLAVGMVLDQDDPF